MAFSFPFSALTIPVVLANAGTPLMWAGMLHLTVHKTGERFRYALDTPIASWHVRNAVQLADDSLLFQLGTDQICLLRPLERKLALIARGRGPVVAILHPESATPLTE